MRILRHFAAAVLISNTFVAPRAGAQGRDTTMTRTHAIVHSDLYYTRLRIHKIGSYVILPMFAGEYLLGNKLLNENDPPGWVKGTHSAVAGGIGVVSGVNTVTGLWNLWDSRHDPGGKTRKYLHTGLMIASDALFVWAGASAGNAHQSDVGGQHHRNIALAGMGASAAGTVMMWLW